MLHPAHFHLYSSISQSVSITCPGQPNLHKIVATTRLGRLKGYASTPQAHFPVCVSIQLATSSTFSQRSVFVFIQTKNQRNNRKFVKYQRFLLFATVPNSRINSWESWLIFSLRKININQYCKSGLCTWTIIIRQRQYATIIFNNYFYGIIIQSQLSTYLNGHLLEAPCEYALHGLVSEMN